MAAPLIPPIMLILSLFSAGCTQPCEGAGCGALYPRADLHAFSGSSLADGERSPLDADGTVEGADEDGYDWALLGVSGGVLAGVPAVDEVRWYDADAFDGGVGVALAGPGRGYAFGASVAVAGTADTPTLLVGAPDWSPTPARAGAGAVFVYAGIDATLDGATTPTATFEGVSAGDHLGGRVFACGDLDADGTPDWVASAPWGGEGLAGALYLGLSASPDVVMDNPLLGPTASRFGTAVACSASLDGDPYADLVVGAPYAADGAADGAGVVEIWRGSVDIGEGADPVLTLRGKAQGDYFGASLAVGDLDGNGALELIVGAPGADSGENAENGVAGAVSVYTAEDLEVHLNLPMFEVGELSPSAMLRGEFVRGRFGAALAVGHLDSDAIDDLVVGAPGTNPTGADSATRTGAATVWRGSAHGWDSERYASRADVLLQGTRQYLETGAVLATTDLDGDEIDDLVVLNRAAALEE